MKKNKITEIDGWGTLTGPTGIDVKGKDGETTSYTFDDLIIATGATVRTVPGVTIGGNVVTYEEQILDESCPPRSSSAAPAPSASSSPTS